MLLARAKRHRICLLIWAVAATVLALLVRPTHAAYLASSNADQPQCHGHGVPVTPTTCACEPGWQGDLCDLPTPPSGKTLAMFVDAYGWMNVDLSGAAESNQVMARYFIDNGYNVTVYVTRRAGDKSMDTAVIDGVNVLPAPQVTVSQETEYTSAVSLGVHDFLAQMATPYDVVYFEANGGIGYYTLLSRQLGMACPATRYILGVNRPILPPSDKVSVSSLQDLIMRRKSIEFADTAFFASSVLRGNLPGTVLSIADPALPRVSQGGGLPTEIVFIGDLSLESGLTTFVNALDNINTTPSALRNGPVNVTFFGPVPNSAGSSAIEYILERSANWTSFRTQIHPTTLMSGAVLSYLAGSAKLAVVGLTGGNSSFVAQTVANSGASVLLTDTAENRELIAPAGPANIFFPDGNAAALAALLQSSLMSTGSPALVIAAPGPTRAAYTAALAGLDSALPKCSKLDPANAIKPNETISILLSGNREWGRADLNAVLSALTASLQATTDLVVLLDEHSSLSIDDAGALQSGYPFSRQQMLDVSRLSDRDKLQSGVNAATGNYVLMLKVSDTIAAGLAKALLQVATTVAADLVIVTHADHATDSESELRSDVMIARRKSYVKISGQESELSGGGLRSGSHQELGVLIIPLPWVLQLSAQTFSISIQPSRTTVQSTLTDALTAPLHRRQAPPTATGWWQQEQWVYQATPTATEWTTFPNPTVDPVMMTQWFSSESNYGATPTITQWYSYQSVVAVTPLKSYQIVYWDMETQTDSFWIGPPSPSIEFPRTTTYTAAPQTSSLAQWCSYWSGTAYATVTEWNSVPPVYAVTPTATSWFSVIDPERVPFASSLAMSGATNQPFFSTATQWLSYPSVYWQMATSTAWWSYAYAVPTPTATVWSACQYTTVTTPIGTPTPAPMETQAPTPATIQTGTPLGTWTTTPMVSPTATPVVPPTSTPTASPTVPEWCSYPFVTVVPTVTQWLSFHDVYEQPLTTLWWLYPYAPPMPTVTQWISTQTVDPATPSNTMWYSYQHATVMPAVTQWFRSEEIDWTYSTAAAWDSQPFGPAMATTTQWISSLCATPTATIWSSLQYIDTATQTLPWQSPSPTALQWCSYLTSTASWTHVVLSEWYSSPVFYPGTPTSSAWSSDSLITAMPTITAWQSSQYANSETVTAPQWYSYTTLLSLTTQWSSWQDVFMHFSTGAQWSSYQDSFWTYSTEAMWQSTQCARTPSTSAPPQSATTPNITQWCSYPTTTQTWTELMLPEWYSYQNVYPFAPTATVWWSYAGMAMSTATEWQSSQYADSATPTVTQWYSYTEVGQPTTPWYSNEEVYWQYSTAPQWNSLQEASWTYMPVTQWLSSECVKTPLPTPTSAPISSAATQVANTTTPTITQWCSYPSYTSAWTEMPTPSWYSYETEYPITPTATSWYSDWWLPTPTVTAWYSYENVFWSHSAAQWASYQDPFWAYSTETVWQSTPCASTPLPTPTSASPLSTITQSANTTTPTVTQWCSYLTETVEPTYVEWWYVNPYGYPVAPTATVFLSYPGMALPAVTEWQSLQYSAPASVTAPPQWYSYTEVVPAFTPWYSYEQVYWSYTTPPWTTYQGGEWTYASTTQWLSTACASTPSTSALPQPTMTPTPAQWCSYSTYATTMTFTALAEWLSYPNVYAVEPTSSAWLSYAGMAVPTVTEWQYSQYVDSATPTVTQWYSYNELVPASNTWYSYENVYWLYSTASQWNSYQPGYWIYSTATQWLSTGCTSTPLPTPTIIASSATTPTPTQWCSYSIYTLSAMQMTTPSWYNYSYTSGYVSTATASQWGSYQYTPSATVIEWRSTQTVDPATPSVTQWHSSPTLNAVGVTLTPTPTEASWVPYQYLPVAYTWTMQQTSQQYYSWVEFMTGWWYSMPCTEAPTATQTSQPIATGTLTTTTAHWCSYPYAIGPQMSTQWYSYHPVNQARPTATEWASGFWLTAIPAIETQWISSQSAGMATPTVTQWYSYETDRTATVTTTMWGVFQEVYWEMTTATQWLSVESLVQGLPTTQWSSFQCLPTAPSTPTTLPTSLPQTPTVEVVPAGSTHIGPCDSDSDPWVLDLSSSVGTDLTFTFLYTGSNSEVTDILAQTNGTGNPIIVIPTSYIQAGSAINFTIVATDSSGNTGSTTYGVVKDKTARPLLSISEGTHIMLAYYDQTALTAVLTFPACVHDDSTADYTFSWAVQTGMGLLTFNTSSITLTGHTIGYGAEAQCSVTVTANGTALDTTYTIVYVPIRPLTVTIDGGDERQIGSDNAVSLSASVHDPDKPFQQSYNYQWSCSSPYVTCPQYSVTNGSSLLINDPNGVKLNTSAFYVFQLSVSDPYWAGRTSSRSVSIHTLPGSIPELRLARYPAGDLVPSGKDVLLYASAWSQGVMMPASQLAITWSGQATWNVAMGGVGLQLPSTGPRLRMPGSSLISGGRYLIQANLAVNSTTVYASSVFVVQHPPTGGWVSVNNTDQPWLGSSGRALQDNFRIVTGNWTGSGTLLYSLGYTTSAGKDTYFTYQSSLESVSNVILPSDTVSVFAEAVDALQAVSRNTTLVTMLPFTWSLPEFASVQEASVSSMVTARSPHELFQSYDTAQQLSNATSASSDIQANATFQDTALTAFHNVLSTPGSLSQADRSRAAARVGGMDITSSPPSVAAKALDVALTLVNISAPPTALQPSDAANIAAIASGAAINGASSAGSSFKRQAGDVTPSPPSVELQTRAVLQGVARGLVAGDSCQMPGPTRDVSLPAFSLQARRVTSDGIVTTDNVRTVGNFSLQAPAHLSPGCYDVQLVSWSVPMLGSADSGGDIVSSVLTVQLYPSKGLQALANPALTVQYNATIPEYNATAQTPACVYFDGRVWRGDHCVTTPVNSTLVSCQCPGYSDHAVRLLSTPPATLTRRSVVPAAESSFNLGSVAGGLAVVVTVMGAGWAVIRRRQRRQDADTHAV